MTRTWAAAPRVAVLSLLYPGMTATFWKAQAIATFSAMSFNFWLNNWLTYRDKRLRTLPEINKLVEQLWPASTLPRWRLASQMRWQQRSCW